MSLFYNNFSIPNFRFGDCQMQNALRYLENWASQFIKIYFNSSQIMFLWAQRTWKALSELVQQSFLLWYSRTDEQACWKITCALKKQSWEPLCALGFLTVSMLRHAAKEQVSRTGSSQIDKWRFVLSAWFKKMPSLAVLPLPLQQNSQDLKKSGETKTYWANSSTITIGEL